jgi:hypothetical protein
MYSDPDRHGVTGGSNDLPEILAFGPDRATAGILACDPVIMASPPPRLCPVTNRWSSVASFLISSANIVVTYVFETASARSAKIIDRLLSNDTERTLYGETSSMTPACSLLTALTSSGVNNMFQCQRQSILENTANLFHTTSYHQKPESIALLVARVPLDTALALQHSIVHYPQAVPIYFASLGSK